MSALESEVSESAEVDPVSDEIRRRMSVFCQCRGLFQQSRQSRPSPLIREEMDAHQSDLLDRRRIYCHNIIRDCDL